MLGQLQMDAYFCSWTLNLSFWTVILRVGSHWVLSTLCRL